MGFERGAPARLPHHARVPDQAADIVGEQPRRTFVGDEAAAHDHRHAAGAAQRVAARDLDVLVADPAEQGQVARQRDHHVAARVEVLDPLVEVGDILAVVSRAGADPDRQDLARAGAEMDPGVMDRAFLEHVGPPRRRRERQHIGLIDLGVADPVVAIDLDAARMGGQRRPGVGRIDPGRSADVFERREHRGAIAIDAAARGEGADVDLQDVGHDGSIAADDAGEDVAVGGLAVADLPLVAQRERRGVVAPGDRRVAADGKPGVGQRVAARGEFGR